MKFDGKQETVKQLARSETVAASVGVCNPQSKHQGSIGTEALDVRSVTAMNTRSEHHRSTGSNLGVDHNKPVVERYSAQPRSRLQQSRTVHYRRNPNTRPNSQEFYSFSIINKELNNMARDRPDRQSILVKNFIRLVFEKATIAKADLISIERWLYKLRDSELKSLSMSVASLNAAMRDFSQIVDSYSTETFQPAAQLNSLYKPRDRNRQACNRYFQERTTTFKHYYLKIVYVSNKHLYNTVNFPELSKDYFERLLETSMKVRYLLGLVHKYIQQLEQSENRWLVPKSYPSHQRSNRILHMSRALKKKYNMENGCEGEQLWRGTCQESLHFSRLG